MLPTDPLPRAIALLESLEGACLKRHELRDILAEVRRLTWVWWDRGTPAAQEDAWALFCGECGRTWFLPCQTHCCPLGHGRSLGWQRVPQAAQDAPESTRAQDAPEAAPTPESPSPRAKVPEIEEPR